MPHLPRTDLPRRTLQASALLALALAASGCGAPAESAFATEDDLGTGDDALLRKTGETGSWSYRGLLPRLDDAAVTVSLAGHTARVTGLLPATFTGPLPYYAVREPDSMQPARVRVTVVYPIATANPSSLTEEGLPVRNVEPGTYATCAGTMNAATTEKASFGGFPFIEYVCKHVDRDGRVRTGIAFHGPITAAVQEAGLYWSLLRGPVSHGCNRMLGEHVLELARIIGFDAGQRRTPVTVVAGFDTFHGRSVDVDYAATGFARPSSARSFVFPTWQAVTARSNGSLTVDYPQWACETSRCAAMPPNRNDAATGGAKPLAPRCAPGFSALALPSGGSVCANANEVSGPFTTAMIASCTTLKLGAFCKSSAWPKTVAFALRGPGACPNGAAYDALTGSCVEGNEALGPFAPNLVAACLAAKNSRATCEGSRWNRWVLADLQRKSLATTTPTTPTTVALR
jgi:hypothetical protein